MKLHSPVSLHMHKARIKMHWLLTAGGVYGSWCPKTQNVPRLIQVKTFKQNHQLQRCEQVKGTSKGEMMTADQPEKITVTSP